MEIYIKFRITAAVSSVVVAIDNNSLLLLFALMMKISDTYHNKNPS